MSKQGHQPQRFDVFFETKDKSGFTIPGCDFVFKYDKSGGWFDEYHNYYDSQGNPQDPPSDDAYSDEYQRSRGSDNEDEFQKEFGQPKYYQEEEDDRTNIVHLENIAANIEQLNLYPNGEPFRVHFRNVGYFSKREEVFNWFQAKVPGIINLIFFNNEKGFNGKGYFVVSDIKSGQQLIKMEGQKYGDREINFELDNVEDFLLSPLEPHELKADFNQKPSKKYVNKSDIGKKETTSNVVAPSKPVESALKQKPVETGAKPKPAYVKIEQNQSRYDPKLETKPKKLQEKILAPELEVREVKEVKMNPEEFASFAFVKTAFPKKTSFKEWLTSQGFAQEDYKDVEKNPENPSLARVTMKNKIYLKLNNSLYNGETIVFTPL